MFIIASIIHRPGTWRRCRGRRALPRIVSSHETCNMCSSVLHNRVFNVCYNICLRGLLGLDSVVYTLHFLLHQIIIYRFYKQPDRQPPTARICSSYIYIYIYMCIYIYISCITISNHMSLITIIITIIISFITM